MVLRSLPDGRARFYSRHEFSAGDAFEVLVEDIVAGCLVEIERLENPQGFARIHGAVLGIERTIGGEQDLVDRIEFHPTLGRRRRPEHRGVGIEVLLEVIERALLQALAQRNVVLVAGCLLYTSDAADE